ncbi:hypothetical protein BDW59DRAFT_138955 [Aspergillus cavernicola]|uniref:Uncharacterized protein n=1 Tax=Aspergillus cavernicola TaxID=176166 RepID=A0ABR4J1I9_9EURO
MRKWQGTRKVHCVIDHLSQHSFASSSKPLSSLPQSLTIRHLSRSSQIPLLRTKSIYTSPLTPPPHLSRTMSSDDAYMSFLDKANADLDSGRSQPQTQQSSSSARTETVNANVSVPTPLTSVDAYYISDTDEPFEPVALKWEGAGSGAWPDSSHFSNLISPNTDLSSSIETLSPSSFDPKDQYASVFRAVRAAAVQGSGSDGGDSSAVDVKVYRVEVGTSRVEYYVLALGGEEGVIVGFRAKAVES